MPSSSARSGGGTADVAIRGVGISCALGDSVAACRATLAAGGVKPLSLDFPGFEEKFAASFFAMRDRSRLFNPDDALQVVRRAAMHAIGEAELSGAEIAELPVFTGLSSFSIDDAVRGGDTLLGEIRPLVGYREIGAFVAREVGALGPQFAFQTACTSSANAAVTAARMIAMGRFRHALVLGVEASNIATIAGFGGLQLLADELKPFDRDRRGIVVGEGVGALVLSAVDRDAPGLRIRAGASNIDSFRVTTTSPDGSVITAVLERAMARAHIGAADVLGIKAHGTGSPSNDASESAGIRRAFGVVPPVCALKGAVGHTLGACGAVELILMASFLADGVLPATRGFTTADPAIDVIPTVVPADAPHGHYLLNFFGFGGHNTVIAVERAA